MSSRQQWQGEDLAVDVLYSYGGVATQILITVRKDRFLVDVGDGSLRDLWLRGIDFHRLKGIFLTHGHFDHLGGLYALLGYLRVISRGEPLNIYFPQGCLEAHQILTAFNGCYRDIPFEIRAHEVEDREEFQVGELRVEVRSVIHYASTLAGGLLHQDPAVGYRLTYRGQVIAVSGDTAICPGVIELVAGADLALIEATFEDEEASAEVLTKLHLSVDKAREIGRRAKEYLLIHRTEKEGQQSKRIASDTLSEH